MIMAHDAKTISEDMEFTLPKTGFCTNQDKKTIHYLPASLRHLAIFSIQQDSFSDDMRSSTFFATLMQIKVCLEHRLPSFYSTPFSRYVTNKIITSIVGEEALSLTMHETQSPVKLARFIKSVQQKVKGKALSPREQKALGQHESYSHLEAMLMIYETYRKQK